MIIFLIVHLLICAVIGILIWTGKIRPTAPMFPAVLLIPVVGVLVLLWDRWIDKRHKSGIREIPLDDLRIREVKYQQITVNEGGNDRAVVPLEEAIAVNDPHVGRQLMLDILRHNPDNYIDLLQRARLADDTELAHYATTSMMEIQSHHEQVIREQEALLDTDDPRVRRRLRSELQDYIRSGLISGNVLTIFRWKLDAVLEQLQASEPENKNYALERIENQIELGCLDGVETSLRQVLDRWPETERAYMLLVRYYQTTGQGEKIQSILDELVRNQIYLSSEGKKWFQFWSGLGAAE